MTKDEIKALLVSADPDIKHYYSMNEGEAYSFWEETRRLPFTGDDQHDPADQAWKFYVHRFTKTENDPVAQALFDVLDSDPRTTVSWVTDNEMKETGYIHHIVECEGY